ncbi:MAG: response regulator transcription factor [Chitinophagaceae bacterium]
MPSKLIIADDHPLLIDGVRKLLEEMDDVEVTGIATNGLELISALRKTPSDIVLLDLQMPKMDGIEALKILRKDFPKLKIIVFTNYGQPRLIKEIRVAGADGFLLKSSSSVDLKEAVASVAAGGTWFSDADPEPDNSSFFVSDFMKKYQLTEREAQIISKISKGLTTKEIALQLYLSEFTINTHRRNICRKLNIYTPVGLVNFAKEHGLAS